MKVNCFTWSTHPAQGTPLVKESQSVKCIKCKSQFLSCFPLQVYFHWILLTKADISTMAQERLNRPQGHVDTDTASVV